MLNKKLTFFFLLALSWIIVFSMTVSAQNEAKSANSENVRAEIAVSKSIVVPGEIVLLKIKLILDENAHANSTNPSDPNLIPTIFTPKTNAEIEWGKIEYPEASEVTESYSPEPLLVYENGAEILTTAKIRAGTAEKSITLEGALRIQVCDDMQCYPPKKIPLSVQIGVKNHNQSGTAVGSVKQTIDFDFVDFNAKPRKLSEFRGKFVLLDFWATWCKPCLADIPKLKELYEKYKSSGFEIIGMDAETIGEEEGETDPVFAKETAARAKNIVATRGIKWTQATNDTAVPIGKKLFDVTSLPTKVLLDKEGKVIAIIGEKDDLKAIVEKLISGAQQRTNDE